MEEPPGSREDKHLVESKQKVAYEIIYGILVVIALASVVLLIMIWRSGAQHDTLKYEAAKTCMQVLGVVLVGFVVSLATFTLQSNRARRELRADQIREELQHEVERKREELQREVERKREELQREVERKREDWQRKVEEARDARQREDELLNSTLSESMSAYHNAKRARRILRAQIWAQADGDCADPDVYDQQMAFINNVQLQFEQLKRTAPLCDGKRVNKTNMVNGFRKIEEYLGELIAEYESNRRKAAHVKGGVPVSDMPLLTEFLDPKSKRPFMENIAGPFHDIHNDLQRALLKPLELPSPIATELH
jgi:Skp family chaperone for outer membrane proteins